MNKAELVDALAVRLGEKKTATAALDAVLAEIQTAVAKGDKVSITGFGVFEKRVRAARTARNPRTGEAVKVKKTSVPAFRAGAGFKDMVAAGKAPAPAKKAAVKKVTTAKAAPKKTAAKATTAKKTAAKATTTRKAAVAKTAPARSAPAKKTTAAARKATTTRTTATAKTTAKKAPARGTTAKKAPARKAR